MVDGPDALQVRVAPSRLRRHVVRDWLHVVRPELPFLCGSRFGRRWGGSSTSASSARVLSENCGDADCAQNQYPFDHSENSSTNATFRPDQSYLPRDVEANPTRLEIAALTTSCNAFQRRK